MKHTYIIPCRPRSKERPRFGRGRTFHSKGYREWQEKFRGALVERYGVPSPLTGPLRVEVLLRYATRPRGDLDNVFAGIADVLQPPGANGFQGDASEYPGVLWQDDSQIIDQRCAWVPDWSNVVELTVEEVETPAVPPKPKKKRGKAA